MKDKDFKDLNKFRKPGYYKNENHENFLSKVNSLLYQYESEHYHDLPQQFPNIFVFGLPRSGTTLMTQVLIHSFNLGYINNFMARFWLAPVTGIKLSKIILGDVRKTELSSDYAITKNVSDLHEFGYFWRYWLHIQSPEKALQISEREKKIDWDTLRNVLTNMQAEFGKPLCMKNIFGAYHMKRITTILPDTLWIYIKRNPADVAISILNARKKFYQNLNLWWSTAPPEYHEIKDLDYLEQIASQVSYLIRFYDKQIQSINSRNLLIINYENLCKETGYYINELQEKLSKDFNYPLKIMDTPESLNYSEHKIDTEEKEKLISLVKKYNSSRTV